LGQVGAQRLDLAQAGARLNPGVRPRQARPAPLGLVPLRRGAPRPHRRPIPRQAANRSGRIN